MKQLTLGLIGLIGLVGLARPAQAGLPASTLYLNRCVGGCNVGGGTDDAKALTSRLVPSTGATVSEFAWGDSQWNAIVQCVKEVYSPYNINIVTTKPSDDVQYNVQLVAGLGSEIGHPEAGGISPSEPCNAPDTNTVTYTFANGWGPGLRPTGGSTGIDCNAQPTHPLCVDSVQVICGVIGQESAHAFGLDHEHSYVATKKPACSSPMTYLPHCGQQFFRGELARCGEDVDRACMCSDPQNSHLRLLSILGPGTPITAPPVVSITSPAPDAHITSSQPIVALASAQRGVRRVELKINGYKWNEVDGAAFGSQGQPESTYPIPVPAMVPDGVMDLEVTAKDDIGIATTVKETVTKGAKCVDATTCLTGQRCDTRGACLWDPPTGQVNDPCTYPQFCVSGLCNGLTGQDSVCTQACVLTASDSCPMGDTCYESAPGQGQCFPTVSTGGGCCSIGNGAIAQSSILGLALVGLLRRRRRRA